MADQETVWRDSGCKCGIDVYGCLVHKFVMAQCTTDYHNPEDIDVDAKGYLQRLCQQKGLGLPTYKVMKEDTLTESKVEVGVYLNDTLLASGVGANKIDAQKAAARAAVACWEVK